MVSLQPGQAALGHVVVVAVEQHGAQAQPTQRRGQLAGERVGADDERALRLALGQTQPARHRPGGQAIENDSADDDQEDERRQQFRLRHAQLA